MRFQYLRPHLLLLACLLPSPAGPASAASPVVLNEFMAANSSTLPDETGAFEDWIEIHNVTSSPVNLLNWSLTDSISVPAKWRFPATNLPPGGYLVLFASGKDRRIAGAPLHTNFKLTASGEYLALVEPDGVTIATQFAPFFSPQLADISQGFGSELHSTVLLTAGIPARYRDDRISAVSLITVS